MTYRKLFKRLLAASTLILLLVWGYSLLRQPRVVIHTPGLAFDLSINHGSLLTGIRSDAKVIAHTYSVQSANPPVRLDSRRLFGEWESARRTGETRIYPRGTPRSPGGFPIGPPTASTVRTTRDITMPLWAPWLVFIATSFIFCRWREKRSSRGKEKTLAEQAIPDRSAGNPS